MYRFILHEILDKTAFIVIIFSDQRPADARDSVANVDRNKGAMWNLKTAPTFASASVMQRSAFVALHEKGIRCKSGTVPATVIPEKKSPSTPATEPPQGGVGKAAFQSDDYRKG